MGPRDFDMIKHCVKCLLWPMTNMTLELGQVFMKVWPSGIAISITWNIKIKHIKQHLRDHGAFTIHLVLQISIFPISEVIQQNKHKLF